MMKQLTAAPISSNSIIVQQQSSSSSLVFSTRTPVRPSFRQPIVVRISSRGTGKTNGFRIHYPRRKWVFAAKSAKPDDAQPEGGGDSSSSAANSFLSVLCPLLRLFSGGDPSGRRNHALEVATSSLSTLVRLPWGSRSVIGRGTEGTTVIYPPLRLQLFEFDQKTRVATAYVRQGDNLVEICNALAVKILVKRVREALTELDLSVEVYPCPKGSVRHRERAKRLGGKEQFPFLVDPNSGISMYESGDIVNYLFQTYGGGMSPTAGILESTLLTGWMPTILRAGRGMTFWDKASKDLPPEKLELFSFESNPFARIVREALCELELPYILQNVGEGSLREKLLIELSGSKQIPLLVDPNTGTQMGDYQKILSYLFQTYAAAA